MVMLIFDFWGLVFVSLFARTLQTYKSKVPPFNFGSMVIESLGLLRCLGGV